MIEIEKNIPISHQSKYDKYIQAMIDMKSGESFVVNDYKIVDAVRGFAWRKEYKIKYRTIAREKYRIWKL
tara:strand:+ start:433 stop:642 length:210 start_codon:yes stop_codon:yes gene_type:complete